jgi:hypothetical protein
MTELTLVTIGLQKPGQVTPNQKKYINKIKIVFQIKDSKAYLRLTDLF